jgi:hypothetical protein
MSLKKITSLMSMPIFIEPYNRQSADQIFNLLLQIQREEFGIIVSLEDQPDVDAIATFY